MLEADDEQNHEKPNFTVLLPQTHPTMVKGRLTKAMREANISLRQVGLKAGLSASFMSTFMRRDDADIGLASLAKIATALDVSLVWLVSGEGEMRRTKLGEGEMRRTKLGEEVVAASRHVVSEARLAFMCLKSALDALNAAELDSAGEGASPIDRTDAPTAPTEPLQVTLHGIHISTDLPIPKVTFRWPWLVEVMYYRSSVENDYVLKVHGTLPDRRSKEGELRSFGSEWRYKQAIPVEEFGDQLHASLLVHLEHELAEALMVDGAHVQAPHDAGVLLEVARDEKTSEDKGAEPTIKYLEIDRG